MKRFFLVAASAAFLCTPVLAQTTWNNLKFGMMPDDINANLAASNMTLEREATSGGFRVKPDWKWTPQPDAHELSFRVAIAGTAGGGLTKVALLQDPKPLEARIPELPVVVDYSVTPVNKFLTDKYGAPSVRKGMCDLAGQPLVNALINDDMATCEQTWNSGGQIITSRWSYFAQRHQFNLLLIYAPAGPVTPIPSAPAAPADSSAAPSAAPDSSSAAPATAEPAAATPAATAPEAAAPVPQAAPAASAPAPVQQAPLTPAVPLPPPSSR